MATKIWLRRFNPEANFFARISLRVLDEKILLPGDPVDKSQFTTRRLRQLFEIRRIMTQDQIDEDPKLKELRQASIDRAYKENPPVLKKPSNRYVVKMKDRFYVKEGTKIIAGPMGKLEAEELIHEAA